MRIVSLFLIILLFRLFSIGQNLIPDPGFEIHTENCEGGIPLVHWFNPNMASPDLYSTVDCDFLLDEELIQLLGIPLPLEGISYIGLYCCMNPISVNQTREYLTIELLEELESGHEYSLQFILSRLVNSDIAINSFGVYFSQSPPSDAGSHVLNVEPQLETSGDILTPDLVWMEISFLYVAEGGEKFMTIGNFRYPDEMLWIDLEITPDDFNSAYYLFDNFRLYSKENTVLNCALGNKFRFNPNSGLIESSEPLKFSIYSVSGALVCSGITDIGANFIELQHLNRGMYFLQMSSDEGNYVKKFLKE